MIVDQLVLDFTALPVWRCGIDGCATESIEGSPRLGITFCSRHGWWPMWRPAAPEGRRR